MRKLRLFIALLFVGVLAAGCADDRELTGPAPQFSTLELSDVLPFQLMSTTEDYFDFASDLPNSVYFPLAGGLDWKVEGRDCCIRDDVVELYVDACYIGMIDSRGGDYGTHEYVAFDLRLPPGAYMLEYRNVVSSVGPSGWYSRRTDEAFGTIEDAMVPDCFTGALDIKPGSWPNSINRKANGVTPVAILGSESFDVTSLDVTTLTFAGAMTPAHDLTLPDVYADHLQDVNADGYMDLVTHWYTQDLVLADDATEACMMGDHFYACDAVRIVK